MANILTGISVLASIALLFCPVFTAAFYFIYLAAGITDVADGAVARKTNTVSEFGSRLDTAADLIFAAVCLLKLLPVLSLPMYIYQWIAVIAVIKLCSIFIGYKRQKKLTAVHSAINKAAGALCFVFPFTVGAFDIKYSAAVVCTAATLAALHEGCLVYRQA